MTQQKTPTRLDELSPTDRGLVELHSTAGIAQSAGHVSLSIGGCDVNAYYVCALEDSNKVDRVVAVVDNASGELISESVEKVRKLIQDNLHIVE
jgi:hypothetical protein